MSRESEQNFFKEDIQMTKRHMKKMVKVTKHKRHANKNHNALSHFSEWLLSINQQTGCEKRGTLCTADGDEDWGSHWWKTVWAFLINLKMELPFDPAISLLGIYFPNHKIPIRKKICIPTFIAALFTIAKIWKQPKCSSVSE